MGVPVRDRLLEKIPFDALCGVSVRFKTGSSRPITAYAVVLSVLSWLCSFGLKEL